MCDCVYNRRGFLEIECYECETASREEHERKQQSMSMSPAMADAWERWGDTIMEQIGE